MYNTLRLLGLIILTSASLSVSAQEIRNLNNYAFAPGFVNPAYVGNHGAVELDLNFRKQWYGIQGAPEVGSLLLQLPLNNKLSLGVDLGNDKRGLLNTFHGEGIFAYKIALGNKDDGSNMLGFGLTFGVGKTNIDLDQVMDANDPALANVMDNSFSIEGKFGVFYRVKGLDIGFTLPKLFRPNYNEVGFGEITLEPLNYTQSFIKANIAISENLRLEPWINFRTYDNLDPDIEVLALFHLKNIISFGGSYRIDSGPTFYIGFNISPKIRSSYSYELSNSQVPGFNQGTHEFQVALFLNEKTQHVAEAEVEEEPTAIEPLVVEPEPAVEEVKQEAVKEEVVTPKKDPIVQEVKPPVEEIEKEEPEVIVETKPEVVPTPVVPNNPLKFTPGNYLVVGVFKSKANADNYLKKLAADNYKPILKQGEQKDLFYVVLETSADLSGLRESRNSIRKSDKFEFKNAWILSIK